MEKEQRSFDAAEIRASESKFQITGVAVKYNQPSAEDVPAPGWREIIAPGAFEDSLAGKNGVDGDIRALWQHDYSKILGREKNGTLVLNDSPTALRYTVQLNPDSPEHQSYFAAVKRGDVDGVSFSFHKLVDDWDAATKIRTVSAAELYEISPVSRPAYNVGTSAQARAAEARAAAVAAARKLELLPQFRAKLYKFRELQTIMAKRFVTALREVDGTGPGYDFRDHLYFLSQLGEYVSTELARARSMWDSGNGDYCDPASPLYDPSTCDDFEQCQVAIESFCNKIAARCLKMGAKK